MVTHVPQLVLFPRYGDQDAGGPFDQVVEKMTKAIREHSITVNHAATLPVQYAGISRLAPAGEYIPLSAAHGF
jgi:hypothetical protein